MNPLIYNDSVYIPKPICRFLKHTNTNTFLKWNKNVSRRYVCRTQINPDEQSDDLVANHQCRLRASFSLHSNQAVRLHWAIIEFARILTVNVTLPFFRFFESDCRLIKKLFLFSQTNLICFFYKCQPYWEALLLFHSNKFISYKPGQFS